MSNPEYYMICPLCDGACGWESIHGKEKLWITCHRCGGTGEIDQTTYQIYREEVMGEEKFETLRDKAL